MNWKQQIFKPKWQHKDAAIRLEAVTTEQEPELLTALATICLEDEDASVRGVAARRLSDLETLSTALASEQEKAVLKIIAERMRQLAAAGGEDRAPLEVRQKVVAESSDRELLEAVAGAAPETELRKAALRKIDRQGFLGDRAIADPDPDIRSMAAAAITQHSTLKRVIAETRTTDKTLHQALEDRLHRELLAEGDQEAVDKEALAICMEVEHAAVSPAKVDNARLKEFKARWTSLGGRARPEHQQRFARDLARLSEDDPKQQSDAEPGVAPPAQKPEAPPDTVPEAQPPLTEGHPATREQTAAEEPPAAEGPASAILAEATQVLRDYAALPAAKLAARKIASLEKTWKSAWATLAVPNREEARLKDEAGELLNKLRSKLEAASARRDGLLEKAGALVEELRRDVEGGELHKALEIRALLQKLGKKLGKEPGWRKLSAQVNSMQGQLRELREWHHWSNNQIRKAMIKEMEALPLADLHPDAVLDRIKELQARWKELEQSEQIPGDKHFAAAPWMWRKFNAAGRKAFEATKPFLDKRTEIQKKHLESMRALTGHITELAAAETPDWPELGQAVRKGRQEMRSLGEVPARARHKMAQRLKAALEKGNAALQSHYEVVEKHKLKLIREAAQLTHVADRDEAISRAKSLQAEWKAAGSLWRSRENQLWREFREPLDPLFEGLKAEQRSQREHLEALLAEQKTLCASLDSVLKLDDDELAGQHGKVQGLRDAWKDIRRPDRRLQQNFGRLFERFEERQNALQRQAEQAMRAHCWDKADLLHQAESKALAGKLTKTMRTRLQKAWPGAAGGEELDQQLDQRFESVMGEDSALVPESEPGQDVVEAARKQCICLEFLAGVPSPDEEKDLRMQYQVDRLSESLSGERTRMSALEEAKLLEAEWLALPFIPDPDYAPFKARIQVALAKLYEG